MVSRLKFLHMVGEKKLPLRIENLGFRYQRRAEPSLTGLSLDLHPGEIVLVAGASGCGKTTLLRCINGLAPRIYQGEMSGSVQIFGKSVESLRMSELSQSVGTLLQDPERQIVSSHVFNEVAFGLENLAVPRQRIQYRVDEILDYLGISHLRNKATFQLSGGEKQKVALAGILVMQPKILLLDEPLASLDPASSAEALQIFRRLADDGSAIILVEHRVEDVLSIHPDRVLSLENGREEFCGASDAYLDFVKSPRVKLPAEVMLNKMIGLPKSYIQTTISGDSHHELIRFEQVNFRYSANEGYVLRDINFSINSGDVIAVLGPNGAGKTTLVKHILGLLKPTTGVVLIEGKPTQQISVAEAAQSVGYVFQSPSQMLFAETVEKELEFGPKNLNHHPATIEENVDWAIKTVHLEGERKTPPLGLSFGQQKRVSIASVLAMRSRILIMDEPTAGQDYWNYVSFMDSILQTLGFDAILFITHDVDLAMMFANKILLMKDGVILTVGAPEVVLNNDDLLQSARLLPTSLVKLNRKLLPQTGRFMRIEALANFVSSVENAKEV